MGKLGLLRTWRVAALTGALLLAGMSATAAPASAAESPTVVSLTFNDGLSSQYRNAVPVLRSHGMNGTFYVASNWVKSNDAKYMRFYHLDELVRDGNEIGGMGRDHRNLTTSYSSDPAVDLAYKQDQVCGDRQALADWGYDPQSFAYPGGAENTQVQAIVRDCGFTSGRVAGGLSATGPTYAEAVPPANPLRLRPANLAAAPITLQALQNAVTAASNNGGGWLPIGFNQVCDQAAADYASCMSTPKPIDSAVLSSFLDWLGNGAPAGTTVATVRQVMGSPQPSLPPRPFVVSLTFDDGLRSQYGLKDIFARHDAEGTFYINSGAVDAGEAGTMSWDQIRDLQAAGHDMGGHTRDHVNLLSAETTFDYKWDQTCQDRVRLLEEGINAVSFAYPFGAMDATAQPIVRGCGYQSGRKAGTVTSDGPIYSETIPVTENPYAIRILGTNYNGAVTLEALQYAVNQAIRYGGSWLPTLYHQICYHDQPNYETCMSGYRPVDDLTIDAFLTWIDSQADRNISVKTIADVMGGGVTAPLVSVTGPAADATVSAGQPELTGTASGTGPVSVRVYQGQYSTGTVLTTLTASVSNGSWSVQPGTALSDGTYTVQAAQPAGAATGTSVPVTFTVDSTSTPADTVAPEVAVSSPADGATVDTATPTVEGTAGTAAGDDATVGLDLWAGTDTSGTPAQTLTGSVGTDGSWSVTPSSLDDGTYTVRAGQSDAAGNTGRSAPVTFTVATTVADTTAPEVSITTPTTGAAVSAASWSVSGTGGTAQGDEPSVTVDVFSGTATSGTPVSSTSASLSSGAWSSTVSGLAAGTYTLVASQRDAAGNTGRSGPVQVTVAAPLTVTSASPTALGQGATGARVVLAGAGFDATSQVAFSGAGVSASVTGWTATQLTLAVTVGPAAETGARNVTVTNGDGRQGTCSGCLSVVLGPKITSVTPSTIRRGGSTTVTITGANFGSQMAVDVSGSGVNTGTMRVLSPTTMTVVLRVTTSAPLTARSVTVRNRSNLGRVVLANAVTVVA